MKKIFLFLLTVTLGLFLFQGCTEEQSQLDLESIENLVTISGTVVYSTGVDTTSNDYTLEVKKPAIDRKVYIEVAYSDYTPGASGIKIFETVTDENGDFTVEVPTTTTGITATIRLEEFTAYYNEYVKIEDDKPVFKTRLRRFDTAIPPITGLKPGVFSFPDHIDYNSTEIDLEGYDEKITLTGNVQLAYETSYRTGAYKPATSGVVELEVTYDPLGTPLTLTFGTTADGSGNYSITIPLKSYKEGFEINKVSVLGIGQNSYTHYDKPNSSITLTGAYQTTNATGFPVTLTNIVENMPYSLGKQHLKFTPNYNNGLPSENAPESWSNDLAGWEQYAGYNETVTLTGTYNLANETAYAIGSYNAAVRTIKINVTYGVLPAKTLIAATNADGSFSVDLPVKTSTDAYTVSIAAPEEKEFVHYKTTSETTTLRGNYALYKNIKKDDPQWNELGDYYYKFTPTTPPTTWHANLAGWTKIKDYNLFATVSGKIHFAKETAFAQGEYENVANRVIGVTAGGNTYEAPILAGGLINIPIPIEHDGDELAVALATSSISGIKDFIHYTKGGTTDSRILAGTYNATQLKPSTAKWNELGDIYYKFTPTTAPTTWQTNLAGWQVALGYNSSEIIRGSIKLPIETAFRKGSYAGAAYEIVKLSCNGFSLVGATDENGEFAIPVPLKFSDDEPAVSWDASMNTISTELFSHYRKPASSTTEILSGNYTIKTTDVPVGATWNRIGTRYYSFSPSGSPTNWSARLPGWEFVPKSTAMVTIKGKVKKATQKNEGGLWIANWSIDKDRMVTVNVSGTNYDLISNAIGEFSFNLPVVTVPASYTISINPTNDASEVTFLHHPDVNTSEAINIYGKYNSANNIANRVISKDATSNLYEVTESAKMLFTPTVTPDGWASYSWSTILSSED